MATAQIQIDEMLTDLQGLLAQIQSLRQRFAEVEEGFVQIQRDYDKKMSRLNAEAERLEAQRASLKSRLDPRIKAFPQPIPPVGRPTPPKEVINVKPVVDTPPPPPPRESPRTARKRFLARHIYYFIDGDQVSIMQVINAALDDDRRDMEDMLEILTWGDIWTARADWETLEDQYNRLSEWHQALKGRLTHWQSELRKQENDPRYDLWQKWQKSSQEEWSNYLDILAHAQGEENSQMAHEVAELEQALRDKPAEEEVPDA